MPTPLPNLGAQRQLQKLGALAKNVGPGLFSPSQTSRPVPPSLTSMGAGLSGAGGLPSGFGTIGTMSGSPFGNLSLPSFRPPNFGGTGQQQTGTGPGGQPTMGGGTGSVGAFDGGLAVLNQYDAAFAAAGAKYGIDPNWLKALAAMEGGWGAGATSGAGAQGIMQIMPGGYADLEAQYPGWQSDPSQNIMLGAAILNAKMQENGGSLEMGTQRYLGVGTDPWTGISTEKYLSNIQGYYRQLQQNGGSFSGGGAVAPVNGMWGGNPVGNSFVQQAMQYQGVPYVWGSIPGASEDPFRTGWDCSGFTYFMSQKYGDGSIPMGSHYQYQYAQQTGRLFTDPSQMQPGDLVFINTGWQGGAGAEMNQAGHVGIYIGNGQMIHAANPSTGTIISPLSGYGGILGYMHQSGSGGSGVSNGPLTAAGYGGTPYGGTNAGGGGLNQAIANFLRSWGR